MSYKTLPLYKTAIAVCASLALTGCPDKSKPIDEKTTPVQETVKMQPAAVFNGDSAYAFVEKQVSFGPRVPNTQGHVNCGKYLVNTLKRLGWQVTEQDFEAMAFDGKILRSKNIIAAFNPAATKRILLAAHWDSRPFADQDTERQNEPIPGANDGGSGVGVLLEVARALQQHSAKPNVGVDIILFDSEDYGQPQHLTQPSFKEDTWCLGSQHWAKNKHNPNYSAFYGILLDMVGGFNARFYQEGQSMRYAPSVVKNVWDTAHKIGYSGYFVYEPSDPITDDHVYINQLAGIPTIDIIQYDPSDNNFFNNDWHTHRDNMNIIDKNTLKAVGQTLLQVIYNEPAPQPVN